MHHTNMAWSVALALALGACTPSTPPEAPGGTRGGETPTHAVALAMDGRCVETRDDGSSTFTYEGGRLLTSSESSLDFRTTYTYDGTRLTRVARSIRSEFAFTKDLTYDTSGRLLVLTTRGTERGPSQERRTFEYDAHGRLSRWLDSAQDEDEEQVTYVCAYRYDTAGRVAEEVCGVPAAPDEPDEPPSISRYRYDARGNLVEVATELLVLRSSYGESGLLEEIAVASDGEVRGTETYAYDDAGRRVTRTNRTADGARLTHYTYEGTFGFGAECGGRLPSPPGIPVALGLTWLGISL